MKRFKGMKRLMRDETIRKSHKGQRNTKSIDIVNFNLRSKGNMVDSEFQIAL